MSTIAGTRALIGGEPRQEGCYLESVARLRGLVKVDRDLLMFDEAVSTADFISLHMPLSPATSKVFNAVTLQI